MNKTTRRIKAGCPPPTDCSPSAEEIAQDFARFNAGVARCYIVAAMLGIAAVASYFW